MRARPRPGTEVFGEAWERLFDPPVAHRGLWTPGGAPENSLAAFQAACAKDYAIELDVQLTADGQAVVFHDDRLERLTGAEGRLRDHTAAELGALKLSGTDETIPTLADALAVIGHRAMVYIELKTPFGEVGELEKKVSEILIDHNGPIAVIGFNPYSHAWFADHHPQILRGLDSYGWNDEAARKLAPELRKSLAALEQVELARPDFLALGLDMLPSARADVFRGKGMPIIAWTVRSQDQWDAVSDHCDNLIFEGFTA
ncbi:glycerophosphodiester phosphodiesterase [Caulobacter sp. D4A]|uniref:glycerophosphodiester phosphodiesterase n=1 Tax=unclassified Caulobacter TaxID=2648921 RepID=UPI000D72D408|nr:MULTISPECIES: glycerophosphodiester phosphodiesterase [unclassified Caulobacter]PXA89704.1 glycerophosphodiester phosphodiesterase [Caulobacter sp. D5]PXA90090.1 glycerophosphodiester phosphodiesterase [Caulobacter sp. D4A]